MRDKESIQAVNEGTLQCETVKAFKDLKRGDGGCVQGKEMIKVS